MADEEPRTASPVAHREGPATAKRAPGPGRGAARRPSSCWPRAPPTPTSTSSGSPPPPGISRTAFYFYFRDKRDLLMRLAGDVTELLYAQADIWFSGDGDDPEQEIREALTRIAELYREHGVLIRAIVEVSTYEEDIATFWRGLLDALRRRDRAAHRDRGPAAATGTARRDGLRADLDGRAHLLPAARPGRAARRQAELVEAVVRIYRGTVYGRRGAAGPQRALDGLELAGLHLRARRRSSISCSRRRRVARGAARMARRRRSLRISST